MKNELTCKICGKKKHISKFTRDVNGNISIPIICRTCDKDMNPPSDGERNTRYKNTYGITLDQVQNMLSEQNNCCAICGKELESLRKSFVDHNHATGAVRGILCPSCNTAIGLFNDDTLILKHAIKYLEER